VRCDKTTQYTVEFDTTSNNIKYIYYIYNHKIIIVLHTYISRLSPITTTHPHTHNYYLFSILQIEIGDHPGREIYIYTHPTLNVRRDVMKRRLKGRWMDEK
jgi:hypothetical protein